VPPEPPRHWAWKRVVGWIGVGILALILLAILAIVVLLHSSRFHAYVLKTVQQKITAQLGSQFQMKDYNLKWNGRDITLDVYNVVVQGAPPYPAPPLLTVDHLSGSAHVTSLLHKTWYLSDINIEHPVARVFVDAEGKNNLPTMQKSSNSQSNTNIFDLGIRHALLSNGEVYYNNKKSVLDADLHDLTFKSGFDTSKTEYSGTMSYANGHLTMSTFRPMPHDLDAQFSATPTTFKLPHAVLRSGNSSFTLSATVTNFDAPKVQATYSASLDTGELKRIMRNPSLPSGVLATNGTLSYQSEPNVPLLNTVKVDGDMSSRALTVSMPSFRGAITGVAAHYAVANNNADITGLRAHVLGGEMTGNMTMRNLTGASRSHLAAKLNGVSVAQMKSLANSPKLQQVALNGRADADVDATWGKTMSDLVAIGNATLRASVAPSTNPAQAVPIRGDIHARYSAAASTITLNNSSLNTPATSILLNGTVSDRSALAVHMQANDLHEFETIEDMFSTAAPGAAAPAPLGLYGRASFNGTVRGRTSAPELQGTLQASGLRLRGTAWRTLRTNLDVSPSFASLQNGELDPEKSGRISFNIRAGLKKWSFTPDSPINFGLNASNINVGDFAKAAGVQQPVSGTLAAKIAVHGSEANPIGQGTLSLTNANLAGEPVQSVNARFNGTGQRVNATLNVRMPAGVANGNLSYEPKAKTYEAQLHADGIRLDQLKTVRAKMPDLRGVLNIDASGAGNVDNPQLTASIAIPQLTVQKQTLNNIRFDTHVANHVARFTLDTQAVNTSLHGAGTLNLTGNYYIDAKLDTQAIPLQPLIAVYKPEIAPDVTGSTEIHGTVRGPLKDKTQLDAHLVIPTLQVNYKNAVQIGAAGPLRIDYAGGVLNLQRATLRGTDTDLQLQASVPTATGAPMSLLLLGTVDLKLAQIFDPELETSGQLQFNINSYGQRNDPNLQGEVRVVNANFATGSAPVGLQNGNGVLTLTKDRLTISRFTGSVGGGDVTASGSVLYRPSLQFHLAMDANNIRMLYPATVREGVSARLTLTGTTQAALLSGQIHLNQLSFTPDFDLMNFAGQFGGAESAPSTGGFQDNLRLNIDLQSTSGINLVSRELSLQAAANLNIRGTAAEPVILGRLNLNGGDLIFRGNRYILQGGTIDFVNPVRTDPVMNVSVNTTIQQYNIQMRFWGPIDQMHTNYASDPALPPSDIINLIAFGKTSEASAANPNPPGNLGAESLIASSVSSQVTSRISKIAGISQLSIDPVLGGQGGGQNPGARITIQQRVTSNLFVTFSTDVTSSQSEAIQLQYKVSPRVTVTGTRDQNGGFGFDTRFRKTW